MSINDHPRNHPDYQTDDFDAWVYADALYLYPRGVGRSGLVTKLTREQLRQYADLHAQWYNDGDLECG